MSPLPDSGNSHSSKDLRVSPASVAPLLPTETISSITEAPQVPEELCPYSGELLEIDASVIPPCVYFLLSLGQVVYVGQTTDLRARVSGHRRDKLFDRVLFLPIPLEELNRTESRFVGLLKPKYNFHPDWKDAYQAAKGEAKRVIEAGFVYEPVITDPDLALVIERWADLLEAVRAGIVAMVQASGPNPWQTRKGQGS